ncbi:hypothetical protein [Halosimplex marinum]|uniref:hypothetical protein n=1 Tax=Halosimplex marinum TaxID=3396620 RepID=UPI003F56B69F
MEREPSRRRFIRGCCLAGAGALAASGAAGGAAASDRQEAPPARWDRTYERGTSAAANGLAPAGDGGYVVAGTTEPGDGDNVREIWLYRVSGAGRLEWETTVAERAVTEGFDVAAVGDGFVVAGHTHAEGSSEQSALAVRVDGEGTEQWRRTFNARPETTDTMRSVDVDSEGRYVFAGWTSRFEDAWIARLSGEGSIDWTERYGPGDRNQLHGVVAASEGGYVAVGETDDTDGDTAGWAVKFDDGGTQVFSRQFKKQSGVATNPYDDYNVLYDVAETRNGFVGVGANALNPQTNDRRGWALEFNVNGGKLWGTRVESDTYTVLRSVEYSNLEYFAAGETATNGSGDDARGFAANLGIDGEMKWKATYGSGSSEFSAFHLTDEEGMVCVGSTAESAGGPAAGWGVQVGGEEVATPTPSPTPSPTATPTSSPTFTPTPTDEPGGTDGPGGTDATGGDGTATAAPTPTATPSDDPGTTAGGGGGDATTTGGGGGGGLSPAVVGVGAVIVALGSAGLLYNRFLGDEGEASGPDDTGGGPPGDTGGGPPGDAGGGPPDDTGGVETTEPDTQGTEEVQRAQTVVEGADAGEDGQIDDTDADGDDGVESADEGADADGDDGTDAGDGGVDAGGDGADTADAGDPGEEPDGEAGSGTDGGEEAGTDGDDEADADQPDAVDTDDEESEG